MGIKREDIQPNPNLQLPVNDLKLSWKYAVRALNSAENEGALDTAQALAEIVVKISQQLEFCETFSCTLHPGGVTGVDSI